MSNFHPLTPTSEKIQAVFCKNDKITHFAMPAALKKHREFSAFERLHAKYDPA
jgi:hypothetical protein